MSKWSDEEERLLRELYPSCPTTEVAKTLGRTESAIKNKAWRLGISKRDLFTDEEDERIREWYEEREGQPIDLEGLADELGRSKATVCARANRMGLTNQCRPKGDQYSKELSKRKKKWHEENEHPRGFQGGEHTEETREKISQAAKGYWESMTPEERSKQALEAVESRIEEYGTAGPVNVSNPYSRASGGKRSDLGDQYFRSAWEANYARYLRLLEGQGQIAEWEYEPKEFWFEGIKRGTRSYTPDFRVVHPDGSVEWHEVKGWMDDKSRVKLERMERYHPDETVVVIGEERYKDIEDKVGAIVDGWE